MFETFDHTADLGLRVTADSLNELFAEAAVGLASLIVADVASVKSSQQRSIEISSPDLEYLYFDWLSELLYLFESEGLLATDADVEVDGTSLRAVVNVDTFCDTHHRRSHEVKAITYHGLMVELRESDRKQSWTAEVIVDI